ncbi:protein kinase [Nonomuraea sp. NPDC048892]|uniref:protein kinase domain-containing protein n=1 Tax=Nonomuraea sp. NPDC048892 TaxID=3154624 RepID=UPI0034109E95
MVPGYREVRQLGSGRTGRVFLATYQATGAYVAIKYLNATLRRDAEFMDRFRSDTHQLVEIDDPNVVRLYEYVETPTRAAVVMELVDGVSLRTLLAEHGRTGPEAALAVLKSTLLALAAAHEKGVPHRDVSPDNVLVQADGTSKLSDFGVVVHAEEPGVPAGTPAYMAPELWTQERAGPPADVYAAACVLFEAVRGRPPYRAFKEGEEGAQDVPALRDKHLVEPVPLEVVPDALRDLLRRGLAKDPAVRYASARQFAAELEQDAVANYGPDWEKRGRRHLAELATLLALRFPLARTDRTAPAATGLRDRLLSLPRLPPQLWVAGAAVMTTVIAIMLSGSGLPAGPGTILMPPPKARTEAAPATPALTRSRAPTPPVPTSSAATSSAATPARTRTASAPPLPTGVTSPPAPPRRDPGTGGSGSAATVRAATILNWSGTTGSISVAAAGTGTVRLRISYTRRDGDGEAARTVRQETRTLRGSTAYTSTVRHDPGEVACGGRAYLGILVMTEPAAGNGPQVSEVAVNGPACPVPTTSASASASPSASRPPASTPGLTSSSTPTSGLSTRGTSVPDVGTRATDAPNPSGSSSSSGSSLSEAPGEPPEEMSEEASGPEAGASIGDAARESFQGE